MGKAVVDEMRETIPEHLKEAILTARPKWAEQWPSQAHGNLRIIDMCEDHVRNALAVCLKAMREHDRMLASLRDNWRHGRIHLNEIDGLRFNTLLNRQLG
jgi:hypothetical protein